MKGRLISRLPPCGGGLRWLLLGCAALFAAGCAASRTGAGLRGEATPPAGLSRVLPVAAAAARDIRTWLPATGAAVVGLTRLDGRVSRWAVAETPVFGSGKAARDMSDSLEEAAMIAWLGATVVTAVAGTGHGDSRGTLREFVVDAAAVAATSGATHALKRATARRRPNGSNTESFPSGHTSNAAVFGTLAHRRVGDVALPAAARKAIRTGLAALTIGTGWARVEGEAHYPSDVLFGAALGNFTALFLADAYLPGGEERALGIVPALGPGRASLSLRLAF